MASSAIDEQTEATLAQPSCSDQSAGAMAEPSSVYQSEADVESNSSDCVIIDNVDAPIVAKKPAAKTGVGMAAPAAKKKAVAKTGTARVTPTIINCDHDAAWGVIDGARPPLHYGESKNIHRSEAHAIPRLQKEERQD